MKYIIAILLYLIIQHIGYGQDEIENNLPQLNHHVFIPVSVIPQPFIKSSLVTNLGIAQSGEFANLVLEVDVVEAEPHNYWRRGSRIDNASLPLAAVTT